MRGTVRNAHGVTVMVTADGDMWTALAVKVMAGQVAARDLRIYRLSATHAVLWELFGLSGHITDI